MSRSLLGRCLQPGHAKRLRVQLAMLDAAKGPNDMGAPGWRLHPLMGRLKGQWAIAVNANWRLTFVFEQGDGVLVDYQDHH